MSGVTAADRSTIVFACDAGMGSSAMGASVLRKKIQAAGFADVTVTNKAIANLDDTYDLVVTHQDLTDRARQQTPRRCTFRWTTSWTARSTTRSSSWSEQANGPADRRRRGRALPRRESAGLGGLLARESIVLDGNAGDPRRGDHARRRSCWWPSGAVEPAYVEAMHEREKSVSTYMGNSLAIPHGTNDAKASILTQRRSRSSATRRASTGTARTSKFVVGIAGAGDEHLALLGKIAQVFLDADKVAALEAATSTGDVAAVLDGVTV